MNKQLSKRTFVIALCICLLLSCFPISFALEIELPKILTDSSLTLVKNCPIGNQVFFSADDFEAKFDDADLDLKGIVITSLPSPEVGTLLLGSDEVKIFDALPISKLDSLVFRSNEGIISQTAEFSYKGYDNKDFFDTSAAVTLNITDEIASPPIAEDISVFTMRNLAFNGFLQADSDKDLTYTIVSQPRLGEITLSPSGSYLYSPNLGKSGRDTFTYYASDPDGNRSDPATVSIDIKNNKNLLTYADMESHWANYSAVMLADRKIITGEKIGDANFFYPNAPVTKSDFLVMLMSTCNLNKDLEEVSATSLADDAQIPSILKKYVSYALEAGILSGEVGEDGKRRFNGSSLITRAQAFKMMDAALGIPTITAARARRYMDSDAVPSWATQPIANLESCGIIHGYDDNTIRPHETLSKAQAATLLCQTMIYQEAQKPVSRSVFSFIFDWFK